MAPISQLSAPAANSADRDFEKKRLRETCEQFESILMQHLLKTMRQSVVRAEEPDQAQEIYEGMLDESLAAEMSKHQSNGLAALLYRQLLPSLEGSSTKTP